MLEIVLHVAVSGAQITNLNLIPTVSRRLHHCQSRRAKKMSAPPPPTPPLPPPSAASQPVTPTMCKDLAPPPPPNPPISYPSGMRRRKDDLTSVNLRQLPEESLQIPSSRVQFPSTPQSTRSSPVFTSAATTGTMSGILNLYFCLTYSNDVGVGIVMTRYAFYVPALLNQNMALPICLSSSWLSSLFVCCVIKDYKPECADINETIIP